MPTDGCMLCQVDSTVGWPAVGAALQTRQTQASRDLLSMTDTVQTLGASDADDDCIVEDIEDTL